MEDEKIPRENPKPIISRVQMRHSNTYTSGNISVIVPKLKKKKVMFSDRAQNLPLCTVFNYEQVEIVADEPSSKSTSCACFIF
jgi:hypothetical protein